MLAEAITVQQDLHVNDTRVPTKQQVSQDVSNYTSAPKRIPIVRILFKNGNSFIERDFLETEEENWIGSLSKIYPMEGLWFVKRLSIYFSNGICGVTTSEEQFIAHMVGKVQISTSNGDSCTIDPLTILHLLLPRENLQKISDFINVIELDDENLNVVLPVSSVN